MATTIVTKYGSDAPAASDIVRGELAVDMENGRLYTENAAGAVVEIGLKPEANVDVTGTITASGVVTANAGVVVDNLTLDGYEIDSTTDFTIDAAGDINLDADGGDIRFKDDGTEFYKVAKNGDHVQLFSTIQDGDLTFNGFDGASHIVALSLDMSAAGAATFNSTISATGATLSGVLELDASGNIPTNGIGLHTNNFVYLKGGSSGLIAKSQSGGENFRLSENGIVFNDDSGDLDFRVESNDNANMLLVDAGNNVLGIGTSSTADPWTNYSPLAIGSNLMIGSTGASSTFTNFVHGGYWNGSAWLQRFTDVTQSRYEMIGQQTGSTHNFYTSADVDVDTAVTEVKNLSLYRTESVFNEGGVNLNFRVESDNNPNALFIGGVGAATNNLTVGIGTSTITNPYSQTNFTDLNIDGVWGGIISCKLGVSEKEGSE